MVSETATDTVDKAKSLVELVMGSRPMRAFKRYGTANGGLLAGGIAYSALFSIVAALTIIWNVFMATLGKSARLRADVIDAVNGVLPGILKSSPTSSGMIDPDSLVRSSAISPASVVASLVLLWTAVSIMSNIRTSIQAMFGIVAPVGNFAQQKGRDLTGFIAMALGIGVSSILGTAAGTFGQRVLDGIGLSDSPFSAFFLRVLGLLVAAAVATLTFVFIFRFAAAVRPPRRDLWLGAAVGGVAVHIVLTLGTGLVSSSLKNPVLAASAGLATLLLFVNLLSRILLLVAAFTANPPLPITPKSPQEVHFNETPNYVTLSAPHTLSWSYQDVSGQVEPDPALNPANALARSKEPQKRPDGKPIIGQDMNVVRRILLKRKAHGYERKAVELRARLGQRPLIEAAEREYWADVERENARKLAEEAHALAQSEGLDQQAAESALRTVPAGATAITADPRNDNSHDPERAVTQETAQPPQPSSIRDDTHRATVRDTEQRG